MKKGIKSWLLTVMVLSMREEWFILGSRVEDWPMLYPNRKRYAVAAILDP